MIVVRSRFIQDAILSILQDGKLHKMKDLCDELNICRMTCVRHINDLSLYYNIQTFVGGSKAGVRLLDKKIDITYLQDNDLQLIVEQLGRLQSPNPNISKFIRNLNRFLKGEKNGL